MVKANLKDKARTEFLVHGPPKLLRLAVILDGKPHVSSVWYLWSKNHFWISTAEDRLKVKAIKKNPNVALVVDSDTIPYVGVIVEGEAALTKKSVKAVTLAIVRRYVEKKKRSRTVLFFDASSSNTHQDKANQIN